LAKVQVLLELWDRQAKRGTGHSGCHPEAALASGAVKQVYKITYPTGNTTRKDSVASARTMGSPVMDLVNADFARLPSEVRRDYWVRKEILWESEEATEAEHSAKEGEARL